MTHQVQRDQQTTNTAIAVAKRVDRLKLIMADGNAHQMWDSDFFVMPELFQITHQVRYILMVRGNEYRIGQTRTPDPVLTGAKLSRQFVFSAHTLHQNFMCSLQ